MNRNVLFAFKAPNTYGLFRSFAWKLREEAFQPVFVDASQLLGHPRFDSAHKAIVDDGFPLDVPHPSDSSQNTGVLWRCSISGLLDKWKPVLVVVPYEFHIFFFLIHEAKALGIPTLHIQHGLWGPGKFLAGYNRVVPARQDEVPQESSSPPPPPGKWRRMFSRFLGRPKASDAVAQSQSLVSSEPDVFVQYRYLQERNTEFPLTADFIAVPSRYYADIVRNEVPDFDSQRILITGYLRSDLFYDPVLSRKPSLHEAYNVERGKNIVSYFYAPFHRMPGYYRTKACPDQSLVDFMAAANAKWNSESVHFLIFWHPSSPPCQAEVTSTLAARGLNNFTIAYTTDNQHVIYRDSIAVGGVKSGALTEAGMFNKRVYRQIYVLDGLHEPFQIDFGLVQTISHPAHNRIVLDRSIDETSRQNVTVVLGDCDGFSGERLARKVIAILK